MRRALTPPAGARPAATTIALALAVVAALAASPRPVRAQGACDGDAQRLCSLVPAGGGRVLACLQANESRLSNGCRDVMVRARQLSYEVGLDCQADVFAYCQGVTPGQGRVLSCLVGRLDQLSSTCVDALGRIRRFQDDCAGDVARLCASLEPGSGKVIACLLAQPDQLSRECGALLRSR